MVEFPQGQGLAGERRKWAEALYASTERVTSSNQKGAKSIAILLLLRYPQDPGFQQTSILLCHNLERGTSALWDPTPPPLPALGSHATPARSPGVHGARAPHQVLVLQSSLLTQLFAEQQREEREGIQDSGFGVWGGSMHGGMSTWVEEFMHGKGVTQGVLCRLGGGSYSACTGAVFAACLPASQRRGCSGGRRAPHAGLE